MSYVKSIYYTKLRVNENFSLVQRTVSVFPEFTPEDKMMYKLVEACKNARDKLDAAIKKSSTKLETEEMNHDHQRRKDAILGFRLLTEASMNHPDPDIRNAGNLIMSLLDEYGSTFYNEGKDVVSSKIINMLGDLKNRPEMASAVVTMNGTEYITEIEAAQTGYTSIQANRSQTKAHNAELGTSKDACHAIHQALEHLFNYLDGAQSGDPTDERAGWINEINQIITEFMTIIHARQTRNAHAEEEKSE